MRVKARILQQVKLVEDLVKELDVEKSYRGVERLVQLIIQALLDLGLMAISSLGVRRPASYSEVGSILYELGILGPEDSKILKSMVGLRNILVHAYSTVDRAKVLEFAERLKLDAMHITSTIVENVGDQGIDPASDADVRNTVEKLAKHLRGRVKIAYLFGGRAKGYTVRGDYDIAVLMEGGCDLYKLGELQIELANIIGVEEDKVDILCLNSAPPQLVLEALDGIPIIDDSKEVFELKMRALREVLDLEEVTRRINTH